MRNYAPPIFGFFLDLKRLVSADAVYSRGIVARKRVVQLSVSLGIFQII